MDRKHKQMEERDIIKTQQLKSTFIWWRWPEYLKKTDTMELLLTY